MASTTLKQNTPAKQAKFLTALRLGHSVSQACKQAGWGRRTAYDIRDVDAEFRAAWEEAIDENVDELVAEARRRALDPSDARSYLLLMFLIKKERPEYRENYKTEKTVRHETVHEIDFGKDDKEFDEARKHLEEAMQSAERSEESNEGVGDTR